MVFLLFKQIHPFAARVVPVFPFPAAISANVFVNPVRDRRIVHKALPVTIRMNGRLDHPAKAVLRAVHRVKARAGVMGLLLVAPAALSGG